MSLIRRLEGWEILDSRGRPTVAARCELGSGAAATASIPSGASRGQAEAHELRDGDPDRFGGLGCRKAVANINGPLAEALLGQDWGTQADVDRRLIELDATPNKQHFGANALLAISVAFARAQAVEKNVPLYAHFASLVEAHAHRLPRMTINLFSGGKHAGSQVAIQDVLLVPLAATIDEGLSHTYAVYQAAMGLIYKQYQMRSLRADEGGLAPPFPTTESMLVDAVNAIQSAGFEPGTDFALAVDVAASHFYERQRYAIDGATLTSDEMVHLLDRWCRTYPIVSMEDGLAEDDWQHWPPLCRSLGKKVLTMGDDFLCTNPARLNRAIERHCANALLLKVNQIGTLSEAAEACRIAHRAGWQVTVSARSGETEDDWLADLAVAWGDQIKVGSITQSERLAKYNRLLKIEAETNWPVNPWPGPDPL